MPISYITEEESVKWSHDEIIIERSFEQEAENILPNINRTQATKRAENAVFCDLWPWPLNSSKWHVFRVNLVQIRSAVSDIFHTQTHTHKTQTDGAKNRTSRNSLRAADSRDSRVLRGQNSKSCTVLYGTCWNHQLMVHDWLVYILTHECAGYF